MAFNPFAGFQKAKRLWMAIILMICMVTFVFCTGGMADKRWEQIFARSGPSVATINGSSVTQKELQQLKIQRNFANDFVTICCEMAFRKLSKMWHDETVKLENEKAPKNLKERRDQLVRMQFMIESLALRKNKPNHRYFDGGVKLDDLLEFKLWLAQADKMGIHLEENHVSVLFAMEFFDWPPFFGRDGKLLNDAEMHSARMQAMRRSDARDGGEALERKAITDEYRVKIAQYAVLGAQPFSFFARGGKKDEERFIPKFSDPDLPDEIRAPMTPAQIVEHFMKHRAQFDVTFIPIKVEDFLNPKDKKNEAFLKSIEGQPTQQARLDFFNLNKNKVADPGSEDWGLERPPSAKIQYLIADPDASGYKDVAKLIALLKAVNPVAVDPFQSVVTTAARYGAVMQKEQIDLDNHHQAMITNIGRRNAALFSEKDFTTPVLSYYAGKHPEAIASWLGGLAGGSALAATDVAGATAGYLAWGTITHEAGSKTYGSNLNAKGEPINQLERALQSEVRRRTPVYNKDTQKFMNGHYLDVLSWTTTLDPLNVVAPVFFMDPPIYLNFYEPLQREAIIKSGLRNADEINQLMDIAKQFGRRIGGDVYANVHPPYTTETIETEIRDVLARNQAEEWAQANIREMRRELERAAGDPEKYKRALNTYLKNLKLTVGPPGDKSYDRFSVQTAPELEPLRKQFDKYINQINWYEARDLTPDRLLKPGDFYKMFFSAEKFAATGTYRVATWPPAVERNSARVWKKADPRVIAGINEDQERKLKLDLLGQDANKNEAVDVLFPTADKPILFWRTSDAPPVRYGEYEKVERDRKKAVADLAALKNTPEDEKKKVELKQFLNDLDLLEQRITEGWRLQHARETVAAADAKTLATDLITRLGAGGVDDGIRSQILLGLKRPSSFDFPRMSLLHADTLPGNVRDYSKFPLPKDKVEHPRDDMVDQALRLVDLKEPIKIARKDVEGSKDIDTFGKKLDEINKELFDQATKQAKPGSFVQILTDKPRSTLYVAFVSKMPLSNDEAKKEANRLMQEAFQGSNLGQQAGQFRDTLIERSQQEQARAMRAEIVNNLKKAFNFVPPDADQRKGFDERD